MLHLSEFGRYLRTRHGSVSLLVVVAFAVLLSYFSIRTWIDPLPKSYPFDFGPAEWISAPTPSNGYFRQSLYLDADIDRAWIQLAATDTFDLYVNGNRIDQRTFNAICRTGIYDIKKNLKKGKNVIAIKVERASFPGSAQLRVRGSYTLAKSPSHEILSDHTWKVSNTPDGIVGGLTWRSVELDDANWSDAVPGDPNGRSPIVLPAQYPPQLLQNEPLGIWIGASQSGALQASFRTVFKAARIRGETWVQIAATGKCDVLVNGRLVITEPVLTNSNAGRPSGVPVLLAYNLSKWVHAGENTLVVRVRAEATPVAVLVEGDTFQQGEDVRFGTDTTWKTRILEDSHDEWNDAAVALGASGGPPWGLLPQSVATFSPLPTEDLDNLLTWGTATLGISTVIVLLWLAVAAFCHSRTGHPIEEIWTADALLQFLLLVCLLVLLLLSFDIRFARDWCYTPEVVIGAVVLLLSSKTALLLGWGPSRIADAVPGLPLGPRRRPFLMIVATLLLMIVGGVMRFSHLSDISFDVDEMSVIKYSRGVLINGYPRVQLGSFDKRMSTYELVAYPLAAARLFLGTDENALRSPAALFGTLTIGLLGLAGYRMFDWRVGLTAAFVQTIHTTGLYWSGNAFWPSQGQMFEILTVWCFFEAIQTRPFRRGFLTAATAAFVCSYLTWEGTGFLLPALFTAMLLVEWGEYQWLKDWHLWRCLFVMTVVVLLQLCHRQIASIPTYLQTGTSLSEISTPGIIYLDSTKFNPAYYFRYFLFTGINYVPSLLLFYGFLFCWKDRRRRFVFVTFFILLFCYTVALPAYSVRYCYHYQTLLILSAVSILFAIVDSIRQSATFITSVDWPRRIGWCGAVLMVLGFLLSTNEFVLKPYGLCDDMETDIPAKRSGGIPNRVGLYRCDYRGAARFASEHRQPGDALIVAIPHVHFYYDLNATASLNTLMNQKVSYEGSLQTPGFIDKNGGLPLLRDVEDIEDVRNKYARVWAVLVPSGFNDTQSAEVLDYFSAHQKVVYESYGVRVVILEGAQRETTQN